MSCNLNIDERTTVLDILKAYTGSNNTLFGSYFSVIKSNVEGVYDADFVRLLKNHNIDIKNIDKNQSDTIIRLIREFYNTKHPDVNFDSSFNDEDSEVAKYGYTSIDARVEGIRHTVNFMLLLNSKIENDFSEELKKEFKDNVKGANEDIEQRRKEFYADQVLNKIEDIVIERLSTKFTEDQIWDAIEAEDYITLDKMVQAIDNIQTSNVYALYKEMLANREAYFKTIYDNTRLSSIRFDAKVDIEDSSYESNETENTGEEDNTAEIDNNVDSETVDTTTKRWDDALGNNTPNVMTTIDARVKTYLGSLKKLNSDRRVDDRRDENTDNLFGIADVMDAEDCCTMLYSDEVDYTNTTTMVESIKNIANNVPGFQAFHQLYDDCISDPDFAFKIYNTFAKYGIEKLETISDGNNVSSRTSNRTLSKQTVLRFEFINSVKTTALINDDVSAKSLHEQIKTKLDRYASIEKTKDEILNNSTVNTFDTADALALVDELDILRKEIIADIAEQLKRFYPTIEATTIANYVAKANEGDFNKNIQILDNILTNTINGAYATQNLYNARALEINKAYIHNSKPENKDNKINTREIWATPYISTVTQTAAIQLADELKSYSPVKTEINSRNVHGNQSSDIINNNMITNLMNALKSTINLKSYGKYKFKSRQYDFSNILVEHSENGKIVNYGLFKFNQETKEFEPTEYAYSLLKARLFNGATDVITDKNVLYSEMSKGDYVATSFINFFNVEKEFTRDTGTKIAMANYFMRIPSDAPKNFIITAPRYSSEGLFIIENSNEVNAEINRRINGMTRPEFEDQAIQLIYTNNPIKVSYNQMHHHLTAQHPGAITIKSKNQINETDANVGDKVTVNFEYKDEKGDTDYYVMQGTLEQDGAKLIIANPSFYSFTDIINSDKVKTLLKSNITKQLIREGFIKRTVNTDHVIFKQLRNIFVQELTDAANALNVIFKNTNGVVDRDPETGEFVFDNGLSNTEEAGKRLCAVYHVDKSGKVLKKNPDGTYELTGKVFTSDRFVIVKTINGEVVERNYGQEIIDDAVDFLYGGGRNTHLKTKSTTNGVSIELTDEQNSKIEEKLIEFIQDYVEDTKVRLDEYREFIPAKYQTEDNIAEFALNHLIMFANFNDLFEGDTKFYKDSQTFLKRAKESQASGTPYGNTNYALDMSAEPVKVNSRLNETIFTQIDANGNVVGQVQYELRDKFRAVTVKNTIRTNKDFQVKGVNDAKTDGKLVTTLAEAIAESFVNDGMTKKAAKELAIERARDLVAGIQRDGDHGYHSTTVNDAQSYITFEEWIRRVTARGQFMKYKPLIEAILDESKPVDVKTIEQFIQVQKNFYYDQYYNSKLRVMVPRQIKNAEFVLVPRFIKGTQLEQVYQLMKDNKIDQLNTEETSKAGKANVLTLWDNDGNITAKNLKDFKARVTESIELFSYNNLYTQQETPQHMDAMNKAGIQIMKKILDNIYEDSYLGKIKRDFFDNYCANIKESFYNVMDRLGVELDEDGNIQIDKITGKIKGLDKQLLFNMLKEEMLRQGLDSNLLDYVTLNDDLNSKHNGVTVMPTFFGNKSVKLESIAQSIFNSGITRQKLPGFHAAQITNIGFTPLNETVEKRSYSKDLQYHPKQYQQKTGNKIITEREYKQLSTSEKKEYEYIGQAKYIEVLLPPSAFGLSRTNPDGSLKTDEELQELLQQLKDEKLDTIIGYRIPTEGKQSICIMKCVGFIDDAQGSTIVVPDDWVSQTGSDFDIDSVYGICFKSRINKVTGKLERIEYHEEATIGDYLRYLFNRTNNIKKLDKQERITALKEKIKENRQTRIELLNEQEQEIYAALPSNIKEIIRNANQEGGKVKNKEELVVKNNRVIEAIDNYLSENTVKGKLKKNIEKYKQALININDSITNAEENWQEEFDEGLDVINKEFLKEIETQAYALGFPTFNEFALYDKTEFNDRDARNNRILQDMIEILSSDESMEENFSRSNFEDIITARDNAIDDAVKTRRKLRSPYNFLDQAEYQDDVMSGAKLKAFSVTRDTFCSICNTVRPKFVGTNVIKMVYRAEDGYSLEQLKHSFDDVKEISKGVFVVSHNTLGWSKNNRNVVGKLITAYSSQTTAHILDAVKEGAIPNVNDFTFQVYKLFPDVGSDYATGISFIMQPGITEIVKAYNENKSIYSRNNSKPISTAFKRVARRFLKLNGIEIKETARLEEYYKALAPFSNELSTLFGASKVNIKINLNDDTASELLIASSRLHRRLKNQGEFTTSPVGERNKLLFDLGVIMQFNHLNHIGSAIGNYARVCNPDKFGAKQSIYATEKIFDDIDNTITSNQKDILLVEDKDTGHNISLLEAIYPDIDKVSADDYNSYNTTKTSKYPPLYYFLKYATSTSVRINRTLFETQDRDFRSVLYRLEKAFSNGQQITEKIYNDYKNYILNVIYAKANFISHNVVYDKEKGFVPLDTNKDVEYRRIYGYEKSPRLDVVDNEGNVVEFNVKDINHPTKEEIEQFATLSPAQKVFWIQHNYENTGVFDYIKVNLFNDSQSGSTNAGQQTIRYAEGNASIETIYSLFNKAFYNNNPLVAMTAMDLIKYAFIVEGYKMKRNAINKMISNKPLIDDYDKNGTNIVIDINNNISDITNATLDINQIRENYIRSHSTMPQISTYKIDKNDKGIYELHAIDDMIYLSRNKEDLDLAEKYGFIYNDEQGNEARNQYVKLRFGRTTVLYKILNNENGFFAYPLNLLEANENSEVSVNNNYHTYRKPSYYESVARDWLSRVNTEKELQDFIKDYAQFRKDSQIKSTKDISKAAATFDINDKNSKYTPGFEHVIDEVRKHFSTTVNEPLFMRTPALTNFIKYDGYGNGDFQTIDGKRYHIHKYNAYKWNVLIAENKSIPEKELKRLPDTLESVIRKAFDAGYTLNDVYMIEQVKEEDVQVDLESDDEFDEDDYRFSTVVEFDENFIDDVQSTAISEQDEDAMEIVQLLKDKDIINKSANLRINVNDVTSLAAKYITTNVENILNDLKYFQFDTEYLNINDPKILDALKSNPALRDKFLKLILKARAFVKNYEIINELDIDSEDPAIHNSLNKIKDAINKLRNSSIINSAEENFAKNYLDKISDNPLIKQGMLSVLDGYHSAGIFDAAINDLQETSNPLIQIVSKEVMADIRAKEMQAYKEVERIKAEIEDIKKRARQAGLDVNWDNIVDKNGKIIQNCKESFVDKINELREARDNAKLQFGEGSIQYLEANNAYKHFKLNFTNQELVDEYYQRRLELDDYMLSTYRDIFEEYKKLTVERRNILTHAKNGVLEGDKLEEFKKIRQKIDDLVKPYYWDEGLEEFVNKLDGADPANPFRGNPRLLNIYNVHAAKALRDYIDKNKEISKQFFKDVDKYGFEEELEKNLNIVNSYEQRVGGRITTPADILAQHDDYLKAKSWLEINARFVINEEIQNKLNAAYEVLREKSKGRRVLNKIIKDKNLYDENGVVKATELSEKDIDDIRQEQLDNYNLREGQPWQDKHLISNAPTDDTVFKTEFYKGMMSNGIANQDYIEKVNKINAILEKHYDTATKTLYTSELSEDELNELIDLYDELEGLKKNVNATNNKQIRKYIQSNVDFVVDEEKYQEQKRLVQSRDPRYRALWSLLNERLDDSTDTIVPNRMIYGYAIPRGYKADGTGDNSMVNPEKTEALRILNKYTTTVKTTYYFQKFKEMQAKGEVAFNEWYYKNHLYNPRTRSMEPLSCWTKIEIISDDPNQTISTYAPSRLNTDSIPKDEYLNKEYKGKGSSTVSNYKFGSSSEYDNTTSMNQYEAELKRLVEQIIELNATSASAKRFFKQGYMIARSKGKEKDAKFYAKEAAKMVGWIETQTGKEAWTKDDDVDYATDRAIIMPFTTLLQSKDTQKINYVKPEKKDDETQDEYEDRLKKWEDNNKTIKEANAKIHAELLDRDFESVIEDFIIKSAHYNAVQDNKYMLFYAKNMLDKLKYYDKNLGFNDLRVDKRRSTDEHTAYVTKKDTRLQEQYVNWIRRLVYDQWKQPNNKFTKYANIGQSLTSAKFMMLNVTGGIANITVGYTQIYAEMLANEYFGKVTAAKGLATWSANIGSFITDMYSDRATSVASAVIKAFNIIDFDELNGVVSVADAEEYMKRARDIAYSPQATGEHMMQNGALFSMCHSHRLFVDEDRSFGGRLKYRLLNEAEYLRECDEKAFYEILNAEQRELFEKFKQRELSDANKAKEYAWFRKYLTVEFANIYLDDTTRREYIKKRRDLQEEKRKEFNNDTEHPTLMSQFKLDNDGKLGFKDDSFMSTKMTETDAYKLLGAFKGRVISVNKKIHGVYDKLGAAKLESYWYGGLVMQYHKHIYPGIMKRYRRQGYFNEERGTIEKGCYAAIKDFIALPLHKAQYAKKLQTDNNMTDEEIEAVKGVQNVIKNYVEFATHIRLYWNIIPENERGNIKRALGDFAGVFSALCTAVAARCIADDDEGLAYNLFMYEADRLASESMMYNPFGLISEGKKLWSSPVAIQGSISDMFHTAGFLAQWIIQGDEFDDTYQSGMYAGEHKSTVFIKRNIPMYHGVYMLERLEKSNKYYKLGENMLSIIPVKDIADFITD